MGKYKFKIPTEIWEWTLTINGKIVKKWFEVRKPKSNSKEGGE